MLKKDLINLKLFSNIDLNIIRFETEEAKWAWLAGIVDGEGTFTVNSRNGNAVIQMRVSNKSEELLRFITYKFGGGYHRTEYKNGPHKGRTIFCYQISGRKLLPIIRKIRPYLIAKAKEADLVLEAFRNWYNPQRLKEIHDELRKLHPHKSRAGDKGVLARERYKRERQQCRT